MKSHQVIELKEFLYVHVWMHLDCDGGGILTHGVPAAHHWIESVSQSTGGFSLIVPTLLNAVAGIIAGAVVLMGVMAVGKVWRGAKT